MPITAGSVTGSSRLLVVSGVPVGSVLDSPQAARARSSLEPGRLRAAMTVTDAAYLRHLAPGWGWDSPCGALFE